MHTLEGIVIDHTTQLPIGEARIMLQNKGGSLSDIAQLTGDNGTFKWTSLETGDYELRVYYDGYESQLIPFTCLDEDVQTIRIALHKN